MVRKVTEVWLGGGEERPKGWVIGYRDCNTFVRTGVRTSPSPFVGEELHSCVCVVIFSFYILFAGYAVDHYVVS